MRTRSSFLILLGLLIATTAYSAYGIYENQVPVIALDKVTVIEAQLYDFPSTRSRIDAALSRYLDKNISHRLLSGSKVASIHLVYDVVSHPPVIKAYLWAMQREYLYRDSIILGVKSSQPAVATLKLQKDGSYEVLTYLSAAEGSEEDFTASIRSLFPAQIQARLISREDEAGLDQMLQKQLQANQKSP